MMVKRPKHKLAGGTVKIKLKGGDVDGINGEEYRIEDWWINVAGKSWMDCDGNPACMKYAIRSGISHLPTDDDVLYGKVGAFGYLIHESEIVT